MVVVLDDSSFAPLDDSSFVVFVLVDFLLVADDVRLADDVSVVLDAFFELELLELSSSSEDSLSLSLELELELGMDDELELTLLDSSVLGEPSLVLETEFTTTLVALSARAIDRIAKGVRNGGVLYANLCSSFLKLVANSIANKSEYTIK